MNSDNTTIINVCDILLFAIKEETLNKTKDFESEPSFFSQISEMVVGF